MRSKLFFLNADKPSFTHSLCVLFFLFLVSPPLAHSNSCVTAQCHSGLVSKPVVHQAAREDCMGCHVRKVETHPSPGQKTFALAAEGAALCGGCHDEKMIKEKFGHGPAVQGDCLECHNIHSSDHKSLLRENQQELCFKCHQDFSEGMKTAAIIHNPVKTKPCVSCHNPHSSPFESLLKGKMEDVCAECHQEISDKSKKAKTRHLPLSSKQSCGSCHLVHFSEHKKLLQFSEKELCLSCHDKDYTGKDGGSKKKGLVNIKKELEGKKHLHGPIKEGECSSCHDPHGSAYPRLLTNAYPSDMYANYKPGTYAFCLSCHEENLLRFPDTTVHTEFRNGKNNLHFVHSARKLKGRTCRTCHAPHASNSDKLIADEGAPFGSWNIPIRFVIKDTGGSCSPGCHQTKRYDRLHPVNYGDEKSENEGTGEDTKKPTAKKQGDKGQEVKEQENEGPGEKESLGAPVENEIIDAPEEKENAKK